MKFQVIGKKGNPVVVMLTGSFCPGECMEYLYSRMNDFYIIDLHTTVIMRVPRILLPGRMRLEKFGNIFRSLVLTIFA